MNGIKWFGFTGKVSAPYKKHPADAGFDLYFNEDIVQIAPNGHATLPTGVGFVIPQGYYGKIMDRSSMGEKGLIVAGGVIDSGYVGEVQVVLWNVSDAPVTITQGSRIAQIVFMPCYTGEMEEVPFEQRGETLRGSNGFGSTGE